jgi:hypothetical protein
MSFPVTPLLAAALLLSSGGSFERDMDEIRGVVDSIKEYIVTEYEELLESSPGAGGVLSVSFAITPQGSAVGISVESSEELEPLVPELREVIGNLDFGVSEEQTDDITVTIPFSLFPPEENRAEGN